MDTSIPGSGTVNKKLVVGLQAMMLGVAGMDKFRSAFREIGTLQRGSVADAIRLARQAETEERKSIAARMAEQQKLSRLTQTLERERLKETQATEAGRTRAAEGYALRVKQLNEEIAVSNARMNEKIRAQETATARHLSTAGGVNRAVTRAAIGRSLSGAGTVFLGAGVAGLAGGAYLENQGVQWQTRMQQLQANTNLTPTQLAQIQSQSFRYAVMAGQAPGDFTTAYRYGADMGLLGKNNTNWGLLNKTVQAAMQLGYPTGTPLADTMSALTVAQKNFPQWRGDPMAIANMLLQTAKGSRMNLSQLVTAVPQTLMIAGHYGPQMLPQSLAALAALTAANGGNADEANTQLYNLIARIATPTPGVQKELGRLKQQFGVDLAPDFTPQAMQSKGLAGILTDIKDAKLSPAELRKLMPYMRSYFGALGLTGNQNTSFLNILNNPQTGVTSAPQNNPVATNWANYLGTDATKMKQLNEQLDVTTKKLGLSLVPSLLIAEKDLVPVVQGISSWTDHNQDLIKTFIQLSPWLIGVGLGFKTLSAAMRLRDWLSLAGDAEKATGSMKLLNKALGAAGLLGPLQTLTQGGAGGTGLLGGLRGGIKGAAGEATAAEAGLKGAAGDITAVSTASSAAIGTAGAAATGAGATGLLGMAAALGLVVVGLYAAGKAMKAAGWDKVPKGAPNPNNYSALNITSYLWDNANWFAHQRGQTYSGAGSISPTQMGLSLGGGSGPQGKNQLVALGTAPKNLPPSIRQWWPTIVAAAKKYHENPYVLASVMYQESGGTNGVRSTWNPYENTWDIGLFQYGQPEAASVGGFYQSPNSPYGPVTANPTGQIYTGAAILAGKGGTNYAGVGAYNGSGAGGGYAASVMSRAQSWSGGPMVSLPVAGAGPNHGAAGGGITTTPTSSASKPTSADINWAINQIVGHYHAWGPNGTINFSKLPPQARANVDSLIRMQESIDITGLGKNLNNAVAAGLITRPNANADWWGAYNTQKAGPENYWNTAHGAKTGKPKTPAYWAGYWSGQESRDRKELQRLLGPYTNADGSINWSQIPKHLRSSIDHLIQKVSMDDYRMNRANSQSIKNPQDRGTVMSQLWKTEMTNWRNPEAYWNAGSGSPTGGHVSAFTMTGRCKAEGEANVIRRKTAGHTKKSADHLATLVDLLQPVHDYFKAANANQAKPPTPHTLTGSGHHISSFV